MSDESGLIGAEPPTEAADVDPPAHGYLDKRADFLRRLARIEGQVGGLRRMVEDQRYCIEILTQVSATTKALQSVALALLEEHLRHCVVRAAQFDAAEAEVKINEAVDAISLLVRSRTIYKTKEKV